MDKRWARALYIDAIAVQWAYRSLILTLFVAAGPAACGVQTPVAADICALALDGEAMDERSVIVEAIADFEGADTVLTSPDCPDVAVRVRDTSRVRSTRNYRRLERAIRDLPLASSSERGVRLHIEGIFRWEMEASKPAPIIHVRKVLSFSVEDADH